MGSAIKNAQSKAVEKCRLDWPTFRPACAIRKPGIYPYPDKAGIAARRSPKGPLASHLG